MGKVNYVADDPDWTLAEWKIFIDKLIEEFGENVALAADGGHTNVSLILYER